FPTSPGAYKRSVPADIDPSENSVGFVTELNQNGSSVLFSTLLGGTYDQDWVANITLAADNTIHVAGRAYSRDFPITTGMSSGCAYTDNAFRARLDATGSHLLYSTLAGGTNPLGLAVDGVGNKWMVENVNNSIFVVVWDVSESPRILGAVANKATANAMT